MAMEGLRRRQVVVFLAWKGHCLVVQCKHSNVLVCLGLLVILLHPALQVRYFVHGPRNGKCPINNLNTLSISIHVLFIFFILLNQYCTPCPILWLAFFPPFAVYLGNLFLKAQFLFVNVSLMRLAPLAIV